MYKVTVTDDAGYITITRFDDIVEAGLWFVFNGENGRSSVMECDGTKMTFCYVDGDTVHVNMVEGDTAWMHTIPYPTASDVA